MRLFIKKFKFFYRNSSKHFLKHLNLKLIFYSSVSDLNQRIIIKKFDESMN